MDKKKKLRIAAFGFRSIPPRDGCAGADTFALELYPRLVKKGHSVYAYNRKYPGQHKEISEYHGVKIKYLRTVNKRGFDTLIHSLKATIHIIVYNTGDIVHIQNGGNSIWCVFLRIFGKKVFISQDGIDWKRDKWPWYGKLYLFVSSYITAKAPNSVIFDNIFAKGIFEKKFNKRFYFIPFGSEVCLDKISNNILIKLNLKPQEYFLFVGRFIPDKGLQYLIPAFENVKTEKKLVLVGGSPNPSRFEDKIKRTTDTRILFPGFIYGSEIISLMKNAYAYIQPSDIEGLSPVILQNMFLQTPIICSDIKENMFIVNNTALAFNNGSVKDLISVINYSLLNPKKLKEISIKAKYIADELFSWESVTNKHVEIFFKD